MQTITITRDDAGSFTVQVTESPDHQAAEQAAGMGEDDDGPKTVQTVDEVLEIVREELGEGTDPEATWDEEAAERDEAGYRQAGPRMTM